MSRSHVYETWFPFNVSVIATNRSCLLAQTLLRFAGFHKQPSFGLLRGLLYLEACKSLSASGIYLEITTFRKSSLFFVFSFALNRKSFFLRFWFLQVTVTAYIAAQASQKSNTFEFVASSQAFIAKAGIDCDHWCPYIVRHRVPLCVLLTHVWKLGLTNPVFHFAEIKAIADT